MYEINSMLDQIEGFYFILQADISEGFPILFAVKIISSWTTSHKAWFQEPCSQNSWL